jgi:hypothetical protein
MDVANPREEIVIPRDDLPNLLIPHGALLM